MHPIVTISVHHCTLSCSAGRHQGDPEGGDLQGVPQAGRAMAPRPLPEEGGEGGGGEDFPQGTNCLKIGLPGKLILSKRIDLREVLFS